MIYKHITTALLPLAIAVGLMTPGYLSANESSGSSLQACDLNALQQTLGNYNRTRLDLSKVLQHIADTQPMADDTLKLLHGYIANLDEKRQQMPEPIPQSDEFKNFDFSLGLTLTSVTLFLHNRDEKLKQRFFTDRDNPNSTLGQYLTTLNQSRDAYENAKCT
ncbi:MAG: hypothetical protein OQL27_04930 [Sedimenticola sp.]|nr:hypothetical protein [Sedimenticola sp.]